MGDDAPFRTGSPSHGTNWIDRRAIDRYGELLGIVVDVYDDAATRRPAWLAISTGFFGARVAVAPVQGATLLGADVVVAHDAATVRAAPAVTTVVTIDALDEQPLVEHYCRSSAGSPVLQPESRPLR